MNSMRELWNRHGSRLLLLGWLGISSALSVSLLAMRILYVGKSTYDFLAWNLFLAWIPLCLALLTWRLDLARRQSWPLFAGLLLLWLLFFPNAPYIVTDFLHLDRRQGVPVWFDLLLIFSFAWNGLILGFVSLHLIQRRVEEHLGRLAGWIIALTSLGLSGLGIYLGRFGRWNSWDLLTSPWDLVRQLLERAVDPFSHPRTLGVSVLYAAFLIVAYVFLVLFTSVQWGPSGQAAPVRSWKRKASA